MLQVMIAHPSIFDINGSPSLPGSAERKHDVVLYKRVRSDGDIAMVPVSVSMT